MGRGLHMQVHFLEDISSQNGPYTSLCYVHQQQCDVVPIALTWYNLRAVCCLNPLELVLV